ncbi:hypothetical protein IJT93_09365 [bacterium]|nr:hypothetical protein [bacterium]
MQRILPRIRLTAAKEGGAAFPPALFLLPRKRFPAKPGSGRQEKGPAQLEKTPLCL